jgi:hypothetical protein
MFGSAMGEFTVAQEGDGWIVLQEGRRVGGTLRYPFPSREAAQRYVERELADEAEIMAKGDFALSAKTRVIRETDAELWEQFVNIEEEFADGDEATREAAHRAAGTFIIMIRLAMAGLEADGKIYRTGKMRNGRPVFAAVDNKLQAKHDVPPGPSPLGAWSTTKSQPVSQPNLPTKSLSSVTLPAKSAADVMLRTLDSRD